MCKLAPTVILPIALGGLNLQKLPVIVFNNAHNSKIKQK
jgi:hypothetical protein